MDFKSGAFLYIMGGIIALFVLTQSVVFLVRAVRRGKAIGLDVKVMKKAAISSATFSIVPSVPIALSMIALAATMGAAFSWIRLSVIGSMSYEIFAAGQVAAAADISKEALGTMPINVFAGAMWVMTLGIIIGPIFNIFGLKRYQKKIQEIGEKNPRWSKILIDALFMGIIAVMGGQFIAKGIAAFGNLAAQQIIMNGQAQLLTLVTGAVLMAVFGLVIKATKAKWLENFALPVSMVGAIAMSVVYHGWF
ncbi:MAG: DUF5058 family protein [Clostridia bacterium]|nr:DUF5058 family protein [Clostridia bacterium]MBT7123207.1 DUF5058 family protein [Clostridia bacterium]